jgi:hypothetical protein
MKETLKQKNLAKKMKKAMDKEHSKKPNPNQIKSRYHKETLRV